mgnify:CR=1 FL=1
MSKNSVKDNDEVQKIIEQLEKYCKELGRYFKHDTDIYQRQRIAVETELFGQFRNTLYLDLYPSLTEEKVIRIPRKYIDEFYVESLPCKYENGTAPLMVTLVFKTEVDPKDE